MSARTLKSAEAAVRRANLPPDEPPYVDDAGRYRTGRHVIGRPTLYQPSYCQQIIDAGRNGYTLTAFAGMIGTHKQVIDDWRDRYPEFAAAAKTAKALRLATLEDLALQIMRGEGKGGGGQSVMTIFALKNADPDEWRDRHEVVHDVSDRVAERLEAANQRQIKHIKAAEVIDNDGSN